MSTRLVVENIDGSDRCVYFEGAEFRLLSNSQVDMEIPDEVDNTMAIHAHLSDVYAFLGAVSNTETGCTFAGQFITEDPALVTDKNGNVPYWFSEGIVESPPADDDEAEDETTASAE